jgi:hypothetical protein
MGTPDSTKGGVTGLYTPTSKMPKIEFLKDWKDCHAKGSVFDATPDFAAILIETGYAKAVSEPPRHRMITTPPKEKRHYHVG